MAFTIYTAPNITSPLQVGKYLIAHGAVYTDSQIDLNNPDVIVAVNAGLLLVSGQSVDFNPFIPPAVSAPAINNVSGLVTALANQSWYILTDRPCTMNLGPSVIGTVKAGAVTGVTTRVRHQSQFAASHIVLAYGNWSPDAAGLETSGRCTIKIKAALQYMGASGVTDETGARIPVTFNGSSVGEVPPDGILFSDPVPFNIATKTIFYVRTYMSAVGTQYFLPVGYNLTGGTAESGLATGEGNAADDFVLTGNTTQGTAANQYGPLMVLGYAGGTPQVSCAIMGDSICAGTADGGSWVNQGGYLERVMTNNTTMVYAASAISNFPYAKLARSSYTLANFATAVNSYKNIRTFEFATTALIEYGTNDLATGLTGMKSNALIVANWFQARGIKVIWMTLLPKVTSTDNFVTVANQTPTINDSVRINFNNWLRDASTVGFAQQTSSPSLATWWPAAEQVEVDTTGALALNGGRWLAAFSISDVSGTLTSVTSAISVTDNTQTPTQDQYRGYSLLMTTGAAANSVQSLYGNTTGGRWDVVNSLSSTPAPGDSYRLYRPYTGDGTHPTTIGHMTIANGLNVPATLAKIR